MEEKRRFPRLGIAVDVQWERAPEAGNPDSNVTKDISAGGICLIVYEEVSVGDLLNLRFTLPTGRTVQALGRVVWVAPFEFSSDRERPRRDAGIEFVHIEEEDRQEIAKFVFLATK
ncbi:MAG: PilZ domain-containing protein [Deltaproteobacteria bacterium]